MLAFNASAAPDAEHRISAAFGTDTALLGLNRLRNALDAPQALKDYGFDETVIPAAVELILPVVPASNPRPVTSQDLETLLRAAHSGEPPVGH